MSRIEWLLGVAAIAGAVSCSGAASKGTPDGGPDGEAGGGSSTVLARVFAPSSSFPFLVPCDADGGCPEQQKCFRLAAELAVCDLAEHAVLTVCLQTGVDECACGGPDCAAGMTCTDIASSAHFQGACVPNPCAGPEDCASGSVCTPTQLIGLTPNRPRCFTPTCTSDADCTGGVDGRCALVTTALPSGGGAAHLDKVGCVFAGLAANATACAPEQATSLAESPDDPNHRGRYYTCAGR